jgi:hypothetical protein
MWCVDREKEGNMNIVNLLADKTKKPIEKRGVIIDALKSGILTVDVLESASAALAEKETALVLEAMEAVTNKTSGTADLKWLRFAEKFIVSKNNPAKREASRVIGNIAHQFPDGLETVIAKLITNTTDSSTVIRWGSAYTLGRIILLPKFAKTDLYDRLVRLAESESDNGVKNQYLNGLKKAERLRR